MSSLIRDCTLCSFPHDLEKPQLSSTEETTEERTGKVSQQLLNCEHSFHSTCIENYLVASCCFSCPTCKSALSTQEIPQQHLEALQNVLYSLVEEGDLKTLQKFAQVNPTRLDKNLRKNLFYKAIECEQAAIVKFLLEDPETANFVLSKAIQSTDPLLFQLVWNENPSIFPEIYGTLLANILTGAETPSGSRKKIADILLSNHPRLSHSEQFVALFQACKYGHEEVAKKLLECFGPLSPELQSEAIKTSINNQHPELALYFIENSTDPSEWDRVYIRFAKSGNVDELKKYIPLLERLKTKHPKMVEAIQESAIREAMHHGRFKALEFLFEQTFGPGHFPEALRRDKEGLEKCLMGAITNRDLPTFKLFYNISPPTSQKDLLKYMRKASQREAKTSKPILQFLEAQSKLILF